MHFTITADSDVGIIKQTNQDSLILKQALCDGKEVLMAIICDGMGGLSKGELASATVIRRFEKWFNEELPFELENPDVNVIGSKWALILKELNSSIGEKSKTFNESMGTTFSGILFWENSYVIVHVGDTRIYYLGDDLLQLTEDQTFIAREIKNGNMTLEEAKTDRRRNLLLQCIGASETVEPQVVTGITVPGVYLMCSDGFRHEISDKEIFSKFNFKALPDKKKMHENARMMIDLNKKRKEKDNISVALIKVE